MTDKPESPNTLRQRAFKERQRAAGFKLTAVWIHAETEEEGRRAAARGEPCEPMKQRHPASWATGWIDEMSAMGPQDE
ncbi:hypothetical protein ABFV62_15140 [Pseudomonas syringae]